MSAGPPRIGIATVKALRRDDYALSNKACKLRNVDLVICEGKRVWKALNLPRMVNVTINYLRL